MEKYKQIIQKQLEYTLIDIKFVEDIIIEQLI